MSNTGEVYDEEAHLKERYTVILSAFLQSTAQIRIQYDI